MEVSFLGGLLGDVNLIWGQCKQWQRVDYWGVPFQCLICHHTIHLQNKCPLRHKKMGQRNKNSYGSNRGKVCFQSGGTDLLGKSISPTSNSERYAFSDNIYEQNPSYFWHTIPNMNVEPCTGAIIALPLIKSLSVHPHGHIDDPPSICHSDKHDDLLSNYFLNELLVVSP